MSAPGSASSGASGGALNSSQYMRVSRQNMSTIESSATRMLVATKQLLETLTHWAKGAATETDVSDAYVLLGNEFKVACRAFSHAGIDVADLGDVPHALRIILEEALCEPASQESLDKFLPKIRDIIVTLLNNLKVKQNSLKTLAAQGRETSGQFKSGSNGPNGPNGPNVGSVNSNSSSSVVSSGSVKTPRSRKSVAEDSVKSQKHNAEHPQTPSSHTANPRAANPHSPYRKDALSQLQEGEYLKRRASRRFSAYQLAKLSNPVPGKDALNRVLATSAVPPVPFAVPDGRGSFEVRSGDSVVVNGDSSGSAKPPGSSVAADSYLAVPQAETAPHNPPASPQPHPQTPQTPQTPQPPQPPQILFLKFGSVVRKTELGKVGISDGITVAQLQQLFSERLGAPDPVNVAEIYVKDATSGVMYQLEEAELPLLPDRTLLELRSGNDSGSRNESGAAEPEKPVTVASEAAEAKLDILVAKLDALEAQLNRSVAQNASGDQSESQSSGNASEKSPTASATSDAAPAAPLNPQITESCLREISALKREVAVVKQLQSALSARSSHLVAQVSRQVALLRGMRLMPSGSEQIAPAEGRHYMEQCQLRLSKESDELLTAVDDVQDIVEALRKDVAQRGVRPVPKQISIVAKDMENAKKDLEKMQKYIVSEKPNWKKVWEKELRTVCEEQEFFKLQEDLSKDLAEDLEKARETLLLIEECCAEQMKGAPFGKNARVVLPLPEPGTEKEVRDAVLGEVAALQPDHATRLEAIQKTEKLRQKKLEMTLQDRFEEELEEFVGEGKLKKSGGVEEVERRRQAQDEKNLKSSLTGL